MCKFGIFFVWEIKRKKLRNFCNTNYRGSASIISSKSAKICKIIKIEDIFLYNKMLRIKKTAKCSDDHEFCKVVTTSLLEKGTNFRSDVVQPLVWTSCQLETIQKFWIRIVVGLVFKRRSFPFKQIVILFRLILRHFCYKILILFSKNIYNYATRKFPGGRDFYNFYNLSQSCGASGMWV